MVSVNAGINDIGAGALPSRIIVNVSVCTTHPVRDARKAPWSIGLLNICCRTQARVSLYSFDLPIMLARTCTCRLWWPRSSDINMVVQVGHFTFVEFASKTKQSTPVVDIFGLVGHKVENTLQVGRRGSRLQLDDVPPRDGTGYF